MFSFLKVGIKNAVLVTTGIIVGTGLIYAVSADPMEFDYYIDNDGDGFGLAGSEIATTTTSDVAPEGFAATNDDCNDEDALVNPGATEVCDGVDNNCDTQVDEELLTTYYYDFDGDLYGLLASSTEACTAPEGYVEMGGDCDETASTTNPGVEEICDGVDNNCDGTVDEDVLTTYYYDGDGDLYGLLSSTTEACSLPVDYVENNEDCNDVDAEINPSALEIYDGIDNDCDGEVDEDIEEETYYLDSDSDGYGDSLISTTSYTAVLGYVLDNTDCDDSSDTVYPGATEICDLLDNNCDTQIDEDVLVTYYYDADGDLYGGQASTTEGCSAPENYVDNNSDCDDTDATINPGVSEVNDGIDNNCDGQIDEDFDVTYPGDDPGNFKNHGSFVSAWAHFFNFLKKEGELEGPKGQYVKEKAQEKKQEQYRHEEQSRGDEDRGGEVDGGDDDVSVKALKSDSKAKKSTKSNTKKTTGKSNNGKKGKK